MSYPAPDDAKAILRHTTALLSSGADDGALELLSAAVRRFPRDAALAARHADALLLARRPAEAEAEYRRSIAIGPAQFETWYGFGNSLLARHAYGEAREVLALAVQLDPQAPGARCNLAEALFQMGEVDAAIAQYRRAAATDNRHVQAHALRNIACIIPGSPSSDNATILAVRRAEASRCWSLDGAAPSRPAARAGARVQRKLRIAYVSAFFGWANWMKPVFGVINHHDRTRFEIHMIADRGTPSAAAGYRDHDADRIWRVGGLENADLARHVAEAGIDVLVDLNGYSAQDRLGLFAQRAAPVQLGWFNMFATTGIAAFDALIGDAAVIPPEEEPFYVERILRVPGSYLAFDVLYPVPDVAPPPCLAAGHLTFGSLCSAYKLTDGVVAAWARILRGAPTARLLLRHATLDDASNRAALRTRLAAEGIAEPRLSLEGRADHDEFLRTYNRVDIALDAFPYNGGTTTTEALWQGVPVLTFNGDRWAARTSRSLLLAAGLDDWVAADAEDYVARAIALATDPATPARLASLRADMRAHLKASAACDTAGLCRALEDIYESEHLAAAARQPAH